MNNKPNLKDATINQQQNQASKMRSLLSRVLGAFFINEQTQEELTQRTIYHEKGENNFLPDPNEREYFRNRGIYWIPRKYNTRHNNGEWKSPL